MKKLLPIFIFASFAIAGGLCLTKLRRLRKAWLMVAIRRQSALARPIQ